MKLKFGIKEISVILVFLLLVVSFVIIAKRNKNGTDNALELSGSGKTLVVSEDGRSKYSSNGNSFELTLTKDQVRDLIDYFKKYGVVGEVSDVGNYYSVKIFENGTYVTYYIPKDDSLVDNIDDYINSGGSGGDGGDSDENEDDKGTVFDSTPTPRPNPSPISCTPVPTAPSDCPLWLLSYCVYPRTPRPSSTPTSNPEAIEDCSYWNQFLNSSSILSNTYCVVVSPTPIP